MPILLGMWLFIHAGIKKNMLVKGAAAVPMPSAAWVL